MIHFHPPWSVSASTQTRRKAGDPVILLAQADMLYACMHSYVCVSDIFISKSKISVMQFFK